MKICTHCGLQFSDSGWKCPHCKYRPENKNGLDLLAPHLIQDYRGYKGSFYDPLSDFEENSFWFEHRASVILWAYRIFFAKSESFLEVGCGSGRILCSLSSKFPDISLYGADILPQGLALARNRCTDATFFQMDARSMPFINEFDVIGAFDVLEHISEDERFLSQLYQAVKPGGGILLTVPQYQWIWSKEDELMTHVRRYSKRNLFQKVSQAGFHYLWSSSIFCLVFPAIVFKRKLMPLCGAKKIEFENVISTPKLLNLFFRALCRFEFSLLETVNRIPFGGSLILAARKEPV
ncbi:class I SAM-dependent methyltransferase [Thermodesulfobacteriota bacterium]